MSEENKIRDAADAIKGIVEAVPIYQDTVQLAAKEVGVALQTVAKTLHILLAPVSALVWGYDHLKDFVSTRVAEKLKDVPHERLIQPAPNVAGPALEALRYTGFEASLRELYANLLATSVDSKTARDAHPSFVEIIKQMSPDEALLMTALAQATALPIISVRQERTKDRIGNWILRHFSLLPFQAQCKYPELGANYLTNLERMGLIELRENYRLRENDIDLYKPLKDHPVVQRLIEETRQQEGMTEKISEDAALLTPFGDQFCTACIRDIHSP